MLCVQSTVRSSQSPFHKAPPHSYAQLRCVRRALPSEATRDCATHSHEMLRILLFPWSLRSCLILRMCGRFSPGPSSRQKGLLRRLCLSYSLRSTSQQAGSLRKRFALCGLRYAQLYSEEMCCFCCSSRYARGMFAHPSSRVLRSSGPSRMYIAHYL